MATSSYATQHYAPTSHGVMPLRHVALCSYATQCQSCHVTGTGRHGIAARQLRGFALHGLGAEYCGA
eukprot:3647653-Rhodomonas_salina.1